MTGRTDSHTEKYIHLAVQFASQNLNASVLMTINMINTLRTRLCLGICSKWLKMKLVNISLYTVIDIREYREITEIDVNGIIKLVLSSSL